MTDGRQAASGCLEPETLAAFMDGRLEPHERAAVEAHLAECEDCYEMWMEATQPFVRQEVGESAGLAPATRSTWTPWRTAIGIAAGILLIAVVSRKLVFPTDEVKSEREVTALAKVVESARPSAGRLSSPFGYAPARSASRGDQTTTVSPAVRQRTTELRVIASRTRSATTLRGAGIALLVEGSTDAAIDSLESALQEDSARVDIQIDLAAAYVDRFVRLGDRQDAQRSVDHSTAVLQQQPGSLPALFNRAIGFEGLGRTDDAIADWVRYLQLDSSSGWAEEARTHLRKLRPPQTSSRLDSITPVNSGGSPRPTVDRSADRS
jgi:tetratricopeptide (TPR) repeat protein